VDFSNRKTVAGMQPRYYKSLLRSLISSIHLCAKKLEAEIIYFSKATAAFCQHEKDIPVD